MEAYAPVQGVATLRDQQYESGSATRLDVYFPAAAGQTGQRLPTVVWTHGGAWIAGYKDDAAPYFGMIARKGYTVVSLGYSLAPGSAYPTPIHQVNAALAYVQQNADRFHVDPDRIVMAGDSAGAQITSQVVALTTNPAFAAQFGITPALKPSQLRGVILYCGIYDMAAFIQRDEVPGADTVATRLLGWGVNTVVWAYTGERGGKPSVMAQMSTINHVTAAYPPVFISGGNSDPLTDRQSRPLAAKLQQLGVPVTTLFFPPDHSPSLAHEYQFQLDLPDAQHAFTQMVAFLHARTS
jgi:acetyl esterase/lipase